MGYYFHWDAVKARSNLAKHKVAFEQATAVFDDPVFVTEPDPRHDDRWISTGEAHGKIIVVVHNDVEITNDEGQISIRVRILSARRASPRERRAYRHER